MYNVLHILTGDDGGITAVVKNYYENINKEKIHFDIACITVHEGNDINVLKNMGSKIFHLPMKSQGIKMYIKALRNILYENSYDAVHVHENETSYVALYVAKKCGVKNRIAHAHTSSPCISILSELRRLSGVIFNYHCATTVIGCGVLAGNRVFGKRNMKLENAVVLNNAVCFEKFKYDARVRVFLRNELGLSDKFVVGFVGRLSPEKNHLYGLEIIKKYHTIDSKSVLLLVGDGKEEESIRKYIELNNMEDYVHLLGKRDDMELLYQAFDVLILPSIHEGLPLVVIEALASGLPVLLSSNITREFSFSKLVRYIDLENQNEWIYSLELLSKNSQSIVRMNELPPDMFDIKHIIKKLERIYLGS